MRVTHNTLSWGFAHNVTFRSLSSNVFVQRHMTFDLKWKVKSKDPRFSNESMPNVTLVHFWDPTSLPSGPGFGWPTNWPLIGASAAAVVSCCCLILLYVRARRAEEQQKQKQQAKHLVEWKEHMEIEGEQEEEEEEEESTALEESAAERQRLRF